MHVFKKFIAVQNFLMIYWILIVLYFECFHLTSYHICCVGIVNDKKLKTIQIRWFWLACCLPWVLWKWITSVYNINAHNWIRTERWIERQLSKQAQFIHQNQIYGTTKITQNFSFPIVEYRTWDLIACYCRFTIYETIAWVLFVIPRLKYFAELG